MFIDYIVLNAKSKDVAVIILMLEKASKSPSKNNAWYARVNFFLLKGVIVCVLIVCRTLSRGEIIYTACFVVSIFNQMDVWSSSVIQSVLSQAGMYSGEWILTTNEGNDVRCGYCNKQYTAEQESYILLLIHQAVYHGEQANRRESRAGTNITDDN